MPGHFTEKFFSHSANVEGLTLLLLVVVAAPLKHFLGYPQMVQILGPLHGLAFLCYLYSLWCLYQSDELTAGQLCRGILASFVPAGTWRFRRRLEATRVSVD